MKALRTYFRLRRRKKCVLVVIAAMFFTFLLATYRQFEEVLSDYTTPIPYSKPTSINPRAKAIAWTFFERDDLGDKDYYFHPKKRIINPYHVKFLISGESICSKGPPYLLVVIPTVSGNRKSRDLIRETWGSVSKTQRWPGRAVNAEVKIVFLLGKNRSSVEFDQAKKEHFVHNDIVMADFVDSYRNLSRKIVTGLYWLEKHCPDARFVLKTDDDTFIHIPLLLDSLLVLEPKAKSAIIGHIHGKSRVVRSGRWGVSYEAYPFDFFPRYAAGGGYILPRELALRVLHVSQYIRLVPVEDAYITGILGRAANGTHIHSKMFTRFGDKEPHPCEFLNDKRLACTRAEKVLVDIWKSFVTKSCSSVSKSLKGVH